MWIQGNTNSTIMPLGSNNAPFSIFVTMNGDIYIGTIGSTVDLWSSNTSSNPTHLNVGGPCYGLFIDDNNTLYCAVGGLHQIVKRSIDPKNNSTAVIAGTGCPGFLSTMLNNPMGIFVDTNYNLYVADYNNNRIQLFQSGQLDGTTIAGSGAPGTISLLNPSDVTLDANGNLFIVDTGHNRIVRSGPSGFQCIIGCTMLAGGGSNQLHAPNTMAFDIYGNIYVTDTANNRVQVFFLAINPCSK